MDAVQRMYRGSGYDLPFVRDGVRGIAWREFAAIPPSGGLVASVASVGTMLSTETPFMHLQTSPPTLSGQASVLEKAALESAPAVGISVNGAQAVPGTILGIGAFETNETTGASGYPLNVAIPDALSVDPGSTIQLVPVAAPQPTPAVPAASLHQEGSATYVLLAPVGGGSVSTSPEPTSSSDRVDVIVASQADGWVGIEPNDRLTTGTLVLVRE